MRDELLEQSALHWQARNPRKLIETLKQLGALRPTDPSVPFALGMAYASQGPEFNVDKAHAEFARFLELTEETPFNPSLIYRVSGLAPGTDLRLLVETCQTLLQQEHWFFFVTPADQLAEFELELAIDLRFRERANETRQGEIRDVERKLAESPESDPDGTLKGHLQRLRRLFADAEKVIARLRANLERLREAHPASVELAEVPRTPPDRYRSRLRARQRPVAVGRGLEWLQKHQNEDGRWATAAFMKHDKSGEPCDGLGNPLHEVGITGLATLAFLADGSTLQGGSYQSVVSKAIAWLRSQQNPSGLFGTDASHEFMCNHILATWAVVEASGLAQDESLRDVAQKAVDYLTHARNPNKVWRYYPRNGDNDTVVTGLAAMACRAAKDFGLAVETQVFLSIDDWFNEVTDPETGRTGYTKRGENSARKEGLQDRFPPSETEAMTAVSLCCRLFCGLTRGDDRLAQKQVDLILSKLPIWSTEGGRTDQYFWFWASHALHQFGGKAALTWSRSLAANLGAAQRDDGNFHGSWDPIGAWGEDGGRVYSTAMAVLSLDVGHRYSRD